MPKEIEKKFLVSDDQWKKYTVSYISIVQGYIAQSENCIVRIRISNDKAWLTVKGKQVGFTRSEFEYQIPVNDAEELLGELSPRNQIVKTRYFLNCYGVEWTVDVFDGKNSGLLLAEIELESEKSDFILPEWVGKDVSEDFRYTNSYLAQNPFSQVRQ